MKITFEGKTIHDVLDDMESVLAAYSKKIVSSVSDNATLTAVPTDKPLTKAKGPGPELVPEDIVPVDKPVDKPVAKSKPERTEKQKANDERLRAAAQEKLAAKKAAKPSVEELEKRSAEMDEAIAALPDPAEIVKIRQKTIEDLQSAYASGHQKEVFELLSRFGNGAKSFRELPPDAFVPIRQAIDNGALT